MAIKIFISWETDITILLFTSFMEMSAKVIMRMYFMYEEPEGELSSHMKFLIDALQVKGVTEVDRTDVIFNKNETASNKNFVTSEVNADFNTISIKEEMIER